MKLACSGLSGSIGCQFGNLLDGPSLFMLCLMPCNVTPCQTSGGAAPGACLVQTRWVPAHLPTDRTRCLASRAQAGHRRDLVKPTFVGLSSADCRWDRPLASLGSRGTTRRVLRGQKVHDVSVASSIPAVDSQCDVAKEKRGDKQRLRGPEDAARHHCDRGNRESYS